MPFSTPFRTPFYVLTQNFNDQPFHWGSSMKMVANVKGFYYWLGVKSLEKLSMKKEHAKMQKLIFCLQNF